MVRQRPWEVSDELWGLLEPLLPRSESVPQRGGRPRIDDRKALQGILFVLYTGIQWEFLPQELGFGSGMTCWRRLRDWHEAGVWEQLQQVLLDKLRGADQIDFSRAVVDASHLRAMRGGPKRARVRSTAPDRARSTTCSRTRAEHPWQPR